MTAFISSFLRELTLWQGLTAAVDILVVAYVIYRVLVLVKGTRAAQMLIGLVLVAAGFFVAKLFELTTLSWLLDNLINYSIIFLIVIFQHDIRRGLMRVGQNLFARGRQYEETHVFEEVIKAAETLARSRIGALIVLEREADLDEFLSEPGEVLDARVSKEVLVACFLPEPENTIHDGAVLVKNLRLFRAGCVLPLSANPRLDKQLGTRHRAAIGITEETDAVVVVVSEERGAMSLCFGGNIARDLDAATLRKALLGLFHKEKRTRPAQPETGGRRRTDEPTGKILTQAVGREELIGPAQAGPVQPAPPIVTQPMPTGDVTDREAVHEAGEPAEAAKVDPSKVN